MHLGQFAAGLVGMTLPSHPTEPDPEFDTRRTRATAPNINSPR